MVFVDGIVLTRKFPHGSIPVLCGLRTMLYREPGDLDREGKLVVETEVVGEDMKTAWIHGSHDTKIRMRSDGGTLSFKGNPGRFGRTDNVWNLSLDATVEKANRLAATQGFPADSFSRGERDMWTQSQLLKIDIKAGDEMPECPWKDGARVWSIHLTQNYRTGSPENAKAVIDWLNTQSVARVKKARLGASTVVWGSLNYCQVEVYIKADEMIANAKGKEAKARIRDSQAYQFALENGIIRLEVKCAKDFLKHRKLTYLGNWDMGTVHELFKEKSEPLRRCEIAESHDDVAMLAMLPNAVRVHAASWLAGVDVAPLMSRRTFFRHAKVLRGFGIDIAEPRNVSVIRPKMREIDITPVAPPDWYSLTAA
jgi:hypothetical protein